jgi:hypothetical protein
MKPEPKQYYCAVALSLWVTEECDISPDHNFLDYMGELCRNPSNDSFVKLIIGELLDPELYNIKEWAKPALELILKELCLDGNDPDPVGEIDLHYWW